MAPQARWRDPGNEETGKRGLWGGCRGKAGRRERRTVETGEGTDRRQTQHSEGKRQQKGECPGEREIPGLDEAQHAGLGSTVAKEREAENVGDERLERVTPRRVRPKVGEGMDDDVTQARIAKKEVDTVDNRGQPHKYAEVRNEEDSRATQRR